MNQNSWGNYTEMTLTTKEEGIFKQRYSQLDLPTLEDWTKRKFKWIEDLDIKPETIRYLEEYVGKQTLHDFETKSIIKEDTALRKQVNSEI